MAAWEKATVKTMPHGLSRGHGAWPHVAIAEIGPILLAANGGMSRLPDRISTGDLN
jgi:hypothetical protein